MVHFRPINHQSRWPWRLWCKPNFNGLLRWPHSTTLWSLNRIHLKLLEITRSKTWNDDMHTQMHMLWKTQLPGTGNKKAEAKVKQMYKHSLQNRCLIWTKKENTCDRSSDYLTFFPQLLHALLLLIILMGNLWDCTTKTWQKSRLICLIFFFILLCV